MIKPATATGHRLVAVAARDPERARAYAAQHGIERVVGSYAELISDPEVDVVYNALPNSLHGPWNLAAVRAGKHVLTEKPFSSNAVEARAVAEAARVSGVTLLEGFHYLFHPVNRRPAGCGSERHSRRGHSGGNRTADAHTIRERPAVGARIGRRVTDGPGLLRVTCFPDAE